MRNSLDVEKITSGFERATAAATHGHLVEVPVHRRKLETQTGAQDKASLAKLLDDRAEQDGVLFRGLRGEVTDGERAGDPVNAAASAAPQRPTAAEASTLR